LDSSGSGGVGHKILSSSGIPPAESLFVGFNETGGPP